MVKGDTLEQIQVRIVECLPIECFERQVMAHVNAEIGPGSNCPASVFEFFFVDVDWYVGANEVFEASRMVEVEMTKDDRFDVLDVVACRFYGCGELVFFLVHRSREYIGCRSTPFLKIIGKETVTK